MGDTRRDFKFLWPVIAVFLIESQETVSHDVLRSAYVSAQSDQGIPVGRFKTDAQTDLMAMTCLR